MSSSPTQVAGSAAPRVTNEEVREVLHTHIRKTAKFIKFLDLCVHLFAWVAVIFGIWLMACVVDHWLVPLSNAGRWLVWTAAVAGTAWWMVAKLVPLIFRKINPAYAAKRIEHLLPEFKNGLISWLELDQMPESGVPRGIMSALTYRAARFIGGQDPSNTVDTSRLIKLIGVVLLLFTSLVLYTIVSPKSVLDTGKRIAMPWRSIAAPSRVQILSVKPGAVELTQGKPLDVDVEVRGIRTKEAVRVRFTTTDGQLRDQRIDLTAVSEGYHYSGKVRTETTGVEHELDYWIEAGDATSGPYRVSLSPLPSVVLDHVELKFPAYTKIPDRKVSGGDFEAIEGTRATVHALGNQRMSRGRWEINPEVDAAGELKRADAVHELSADDRQLTGTALLELNREKENPTKLTYRLRGFNQRGDGNREPILHSMNVIADVGPEITLVGPENRRLNVRPTTKFNLEVRANDPDFGLSQIDIEIRRSGIVVRKETLLKSEGAIGQQVKRLHINMADLKLPEGVKLEVRATAYDNRHDPVSEKLAPNSKESELLTLEVVGPDQQVAPDEPPAPQPEESPNGGGKSEKNQQAGNESSNANGGADSQPNNQGAGASPNDPNGAEPSRNEPNQNDGSQEPRQNSTPNPADPNGSRDQGEQQGKQEGDQGKQEGAQGKQQGQQGKQEGGQGKQGEQSSDGKQKSGQAGGQQGAGKQDSGKQENQDGQSGGQSTGQSGVQQSSKFGGNESSDGSQQPDSGSPSKNNNSGKNSSGKNSSGKNSSNSGQAGNEPSNSLGSKSSSPSSNAAKGSSGEKTNSGSSGANDNASNGGEGSKPSDGEYFKRIQEHMKEKNSKQNDNQAGNNQQAGNDSGGKESSGNESGSNQQAGSKSGSDSKGSSKQPEKNGANTKPDGTGKEEAQNQSDKSEGTKNGTEKNGAGSKDEKNGGSNSLGQPSAQRNTDSKSNPTDPNGKEKSSKENSQSGSKGSPEKSSPNKESTGKETADSQGEKNSETNSTDKKDPNGQGADNKGSDGKGSDGKGSDGKGSDGKGSDGKGSDGKGADGKGADGKGSDGKASDGKGSDGKAADAKGGDAKGSDSKGSDGKGSDGKGADAKGAESKGEDAKESQSGAQSDKPSSGGAGGGKANGSKTGKSGSGGSGTGNGEGGGEGKADAANADYANRTTQMVLDYLNRQKDQPDPELLRELNWTENDLRKFTERWNNARDLAVSPNPEDQKKWKEMLEDLGLNQQMVKPSAAGSLDDNFQQMRDSGNRTRPPENLRKQYEAFRRAFEKSGK